MKKITQLGILLGAAAALSSCATVSEYSGGMIKDTSNAPTAKVKLSKKSDKITAKIYTTYNNNEGGSVSLNWDAPKGCYDTKFPITKYGETNDMTMASVNVKQGSKYCSGTWTANVMFDGDVIASDSIDA